jgi:hypothetical protein
MNQGRKGPSKAQREWMTRLRIVIDAYNHRSSFKRLEGGVVNGVVTEYNGEASLEVIAEMLSENYYGSEQMFLARVKDKERELAKLAEQ